MVFLLYFRNTILAKDCADCKMTVNFHITTVVNEDFFPVISHITLCKTHSLEHEAKLGYIISLDAKSGDSSCSLAALLRRHKYLWLSIHTTHTLAQYRAFRHRACAIAMQ